MKPCSSPLTDARVLGWWSGELSAPEARQLEQHLLSCGACSARAQLAGAMAQGIRGLVREGRLPVVVDPIVLERLRGEGRRIREYRVAAGGSVQCTVAPEDDLVLSRLLVDLAGVTRLDLVRRTGDHPEQRFADLPFNAASGELVFAPPIDLLRAMPALVERMRLVAVEPSGERLLGEYTFDHSPWPGGRP